MDIEKMKEVTAIMAGLIHNEELRAEPAKIMLSAEEAAQILDARKERMIFDLRERGFSPITTVPRRAPALPSIAGAARKAPGGIDDFARIGTNSGHGHAWERPDGHRARCGGPSLCKVCLVEAELVGRYEAMRQVPA